MARTCSWNTWCSKRQTTRPSTPVFGWLAVEWNGACSNWWMTARMEALPASPPLLGTWSVPGAADGFNATPRQRAAAGMMSP